ncbi:hypothetical protein FA09DRAFT_25092 [Tilletiopsis washingtonensis]|uniref:Uncharacterized protein n=1 Tax=Tilletiopsis washingtonensis TaxID=58919 RepID=A0A316ZDG5_9BASI|nr:hypothetical protein FA09DRAFT_25092 [Tilletiopsis washingtonensis]PWN98303.1 hypothetical protein FA09DRAFT_25092 [Tilletiopsis washingtonensis]
MHGQRRSHATSRGTSCRRAAAAEPRCVCCCASQRRATSDAAACSRNGAASCLSERLGRGLCVHKAEVQESRRRERAAAGESKPAKGRAICLRCGTVLSGCGGEARALRPFAFPRAAAAAPPRAGALAAGQRRLASPSRPLPAPASCAHPSSPHRCSSPPPPPLPASSAHASVPRALVAVSPRSQLRSRATSSAAAAASTARKSNSGGRRSGPRRFSRALRSVARSSVPTIGIGASCPLLQQQPWTAPRRRASRSCRSRAFPAAAAAMRTPPPQRAAAAAAAAAVSAASARTSCTTAASTARSRRRRRLASRRRACCRGCAVPSCLLRHHQLQPAALRMSPVAARRCERQRTALPHRHRSSSSRRATSPSRATAAPGRTLRRRRRNGTTLRARPSRAAAPMTSTKAATSRTRKRRLRPLRRLSRPRLRRRWCARRHAEMHRSFPAARAIAAWARARCCWMARRHHLRTATTRRRGWATAARAQT